MRNYRSLLFYKQNHQRKISGIKLKTLNFVNYRLIGGSDKNFKNAAFSEESLVQNRTQLQDLKTRVSPRNTEQTKLHESKGELSLYGVPSQSIKPCQIQPKTNQNISHPLKLHEVKEEYSFDVMQTRNIKQCQIRTKTYERPAPVHTELYESNEDFSLHNLQTKNEKQSKIIPKTNERSQLKSEDWELHESDEEFALHKFNSQNHNAPKQWKKNSNLDINEGNSFEELPTTSAKAAQLKKMSHEQPKTKMAMKKPKIKNKSKSKSQTKLKMKTNSKSNLKTKSKTNIKKSQSKSKSKKKKKFLFPLRCTRPNNSRSRIMQKRHERLSQEQNVLPEVSSICLQCKNKKLPVLQNDLLTEIINICGEYPDSKIMLTITLQTDGIYHINISLIANADYLGCLYATETALSKASHIYDFYNFLTIFVANDQNIIRQKEKILGHSIKFVRYINTQNN